MNLERERSLEIDEAQLNSRYQRTMKGVTLLEILIAIIIMTIGLAGILALFQPALRASRTTMEETTAVVLAESIRDALTNSLKRAELVQDPSFPLDPTKKIYRVNVYHDGFKDGKYTFYLPRFIPITSPVIPPRDNYYEWDHHPALLPLDTSKYKRPIKSPDKTFFTPQETNEDNLLFILNKDAWIKKVTAELANYDQTDPYEQFLFSFDVRKEDTNAIPQYVDGDDKNKYNDNHDRMSTLYGFMLHVFRAKGPIDDESSWKTEKEHIRTFHFQIGVSVQ